MVTFEQLMNGFGVVTVMNACIFVPKTAYTGAKNCKTAGKSNEGGMSAQDFVPAYEYIDTLKIANFTQEGPTKTVSGGQYANPLIKYGKTMSVEMQDALGRASTMERFFGCDYDGFVEGTADQDSAVITIPGVKVGEKLYVRINGAPAEGVTATVPHGTAGETKAECTITLTGSTKGDYYTITKAGSRLSVTDKFPGAFAIEGDTFFIDQKTGEKKHVFILIPQFSPDAILTLTQDAEGDATVFDLNGTVSVTDIQDESGSRSVFYEIREESFFKEARESMVMPGDPEYDSGEITVSAAAE